MSRPAVRPAVLVGAAATAVTAVLLLGSFLDLNGGPSQSGDVAGVVSSPSTPGGATDPPPDSEESSPPPKGSPPEGSTPPAPVPGLGVEVAASSVRGWVDPFGEVRAHVVVVGRNAGDTTMSVSASGSRWQILNEAGKEVAAGRFAHAFPPVVAPGQTVLLIETLSATFTDPQDVSGISVAIATESSGDGVAALPLEVSDVTWRTGADDGLAVEGRVVNRTGRPVTDCAVAVVVSDAGGQILGGAYDVGVGSLEPGESATFSTAYPGTPPVDPASVVSADATAVGFP